MACVAAPLLTGCYDPQGLVERVRNDAIRTRIEEVDLGKFVITMPRDLGPEGMTEVSFHAFGATARYKREETEELLAEREFLVRHAILLAVRESTPEDFGDPDLANLRQRLLAATNDTLEESPLESVGFYDIRFVRH